MAASTSLRRLRHELRTPLNHIIGYSEMLLEEAVESDTVALVGGLQSVHADARRLLARIGECLEANDIKDPSPDLSALATAIDAPLASIVAGIQSLEAQAAGLLADRAGMRADLVRVAAAAHALQQILAGGFAAASESPPLDAGDPLQADSPHAIETGAILVVDDDADNREMLGRRLARDGHRIEQAASGVEALALLGRMPIDLVLLDVMMPDMDGYQLLQRLKADERLQGVPVLMISALDETASVVRCIEMGAEDYLPKPFDPVILRARIGACLEKKRLRDLQAFHLKELAQWNVTLEQRVAEQVALVDRLARLKRFFSPQLAELIVAGGADDPLVTHRREVTVCFLDLRGFTAFAESSEPEEVMAVLRQYHAEMGRLILAHEGTLERFTGDGMMIFFNDPVIVTNPAERAVRMALAMREAAEDLARGWRKVGYELDLGIGIAQGFATIGAIGFDGRWDYGAIGSVTNLAARLCAEAGPGQILTSRRIVATMEDLLRAEPVGELALKGFRRPVLAFSLLGLHEPGAAGG